MVPRVLLVMVWSALAWSALWSDFSVANIIWGLTVGGVLCIVVPLRSTSRPPVVDPLALLRFVGHFLWALVKASAVVAWEVVTPRNVLRQGIVAAPLRTRSPALTTLIANSVSLTPGTLTLEVREEPPTLFIHILHLRSIEDVREDIRHLEDLALRAFPSADDTGAVPT